MTHSAKVKTENFTGKLNAKKVSLIILHQRTGIYT